MELLSLAIASALAAIKISEWVVRLMEKRRKEILKEANAGPRRDRLVVDGAEQAVMVLTQTLTTVNAELNALRAQNAQLEAENKALRAASKLEGDL